METPTKLQNLQQDGIIISKKVSSRMTSTIFQVVFLIPFLETSISQQW